MRDAINKSREYERELEEMRALSGNNDFINSRIAILDKTAKHGISDTNTLRKNFLKTSEKILKQAKLHKNGKSILDKVTLNFSQIVHIRKISAEEDSGKTEDIIARGGSYIESGRIDLSVQELNKLPTEEKQKLEKWLEKAKDYINAKEASEEIFKYVISPVRGNIYNKST